MARLATWREASLFRRVQKGAALALACVAPACLVTNDVDYSRPNTPPMVTKETPPPDAFTAVVADCDDEKGMNFVVNIYDPDVEDQLEARVVIDGVSQFLEGVTGTKANRDTYSKCIPKRLLNADCLHVEILVSSEFSQLQPARDPYATKDPHDIGSVEWWLLGPSPTYPEVGISACQKTIEEEP